MISTLERTVSSADARLNMSLNRGASKLVVVVDCSPHDAKLATDH